MVVLATRLYRKPGCTPADPARTSRGGPTASPHRSREDGLCIPEPLPLLSLRLAKDG